MSNRLADFFVDCPPDGGNAELILKRVYITALRAEVVVERDINNRLVVIHKHRKRDVKPLIENVIHDSLPREFFNIFADVTVAVICVFL